ITVTTITIHKGFNFEKTEFQDLDELIDFLNEKDLFISDEFDAELDRRYHELKSGKIKGINISE
ncbi:MAG: addiction module protein, partial [Bacteroidales bacterium]|nr:addiction module protein [Bacteroidales bacterium]